MDLGNQCSGIGKKRKATSSKDNASASKKPKIGREAIKEIYDKFNKNLIIVLPMQDVHFMASIASLCTGNLKKEVEAKGTQSQAAAHFLSNAIEPHIPGKDDDYGILDIEPLNKLLEEMIKYGSAAGNLAKAIKREIANAEEGEILNPEEPPNEPQIETGHGADYPQQTEDDQSPKITIQQLETNYRERFDGKIENGENLSNEQVCVLIQTVNKHEFRAVMMEMKKDSVVTKFSVDDSLCDTKSYYYVGKWGDSGIPVAIIQTSMGTSGVFGSWYETKKALKNLKHLKYIFCVGICGGVKGRVKLGDVVVSTRICGYPDLKMMDVAWINRSCSSTLGEQGFLHFLTQTANLPAKIIPGTVLSGPWLIKSLVIQKELLKLCPEADAFEMEGIGIVQACAGKEKEYLIVKGVSDYGNAKKDDRWQAEAAVNAAQYLCITMTKAPPSMFECGVQVH